MVNDLIPLLQHRAFAALMLCLLGTWPLWRIFRRAGLAGAWAGLLWLNLLFPGLGLALICGVLCHKNWPNLPKAPPKWVKTKIWAPGAAPPEGQKP